MKKNRYRFFVGAILNPQSDQKCEFFPRGMLVVHEARPSKIHDVLSFEKGLKKYAPNLKSTQFIDFGNAVILPGFFDMHFHWVQDEVREMPKDSLLSWLEKYTFPAESKFANPKFARREAKRFFSRLTSVGTLGGGCYSSIHWSALNAAMKEVKGDFVVGNVTMNINSPKGLTQSEADSLRIAERAVQKFGRRYAFTPRFAISVLPSVMKRGAAWADHARCFKQSHLAETPQEIEWALSTHRRFKGLERVRSYTEIYEKTGMLGSRSLMGHGIYLSNEELKILKRTKTILVHCPTSNAPLKEKGIGSGLFDFKRTEKAGVRWVLGSDIGGGPFLSMFDVMRSFVEQNAKHELKNATCVKALYRSTLAGARALGVGERCGNLDRGKDANFIVVPLATRPRTNDPEQLIKSLLKRDRGHRMRYDQRVSYVCYRGKVLFQRK